MVDGSCLYKQEREQIFKSKGVHIRRLIKQGKKEKKKKEKAIQRPRHASQTVRCKPIQQHQRLSSYNELDNGEERGVDRR